MEFLQRHLPRVYQAVQSALDYITNVTAQIFGAPPNAPQPRNAQAKAPLRSEDAIATEEPEETRLSQGADHMTLTPDVLLEDAALEATEESMKIYGIQQDVEIQAQETRVRHRKENVDRRVLDLHHAVSDGKDIFSHHQVSVDEHKDQSRSKVTTDDPKSTKPEERDSIPCVIREILHTEEQTVINTEEQTVINTEDQTIINAEEQAVINAEEQTVINAEEQTVINAEEQTVINAEEQTVINAEEQTVINAEEQTVIDAEDQTVINEEIQKVSQEAMLREVHTVIKNEEKSFNLRLDNLLKDLEPKRCQENEVPPTRRSYLNSEIIQEVSEGASICHATVTSQKPDQESTECVPASPVIVDYDDLDLPDIKQQHKKLVTPISAADRSPCDEGEEARKTWEHLQETAVRLAMHYSLPQDDDQEFETLQSGEITKACIVNEMHSSRPDEQEDNQELLEVASHDPKVVKELGSEETEQLEEVGSEENDQHEKDQKVVKTRRRVHFSPSTEERDQMFCLTSEDTGCIKIDLIQEGALEPTTEPTGHPPNSYPRPEPNDTENDLGFIGSTQDTEPLMIDSTTLQDQVTPLHTGHTVWYDELEMTTDKEMFESIGDMSYHRVTLGLQPEETISAISHKKSPQELSKDVPSVEEMQDSEQGPTENTMSTLRDITTHVGEDCEVEYHHGEDPWSFKKSSGVVSEQSSQKDHQVTPINLEVLSQSSEAISEDLSLSEDTELLKEQAHGEGVNENTDSKEKLLGLQHHPSMEEAGDTTKGEVTSMTYDLSVHSSVSRLQDEHHGPSEDKALVYIPGEGYSQISVQECDTSRSEQLQGDIISTESVRSLSTDPANIDKVHTAEDLRKAEDNEESGGRNISLRNETQKEDLAGKESEDVNVGKEVKYVSKQIEEHVSVKEEHLVEEIEDYTWYRQDSYQNNGLITYSDSNEDPGSQKFQTSTDNTEESSEQLLYEDHESEVMSKDGEARQTNPQASGSDEDSTKVSHLYVASDAEPTNTGLSAYPEDALESEDVLEGFCAHPETGFDLLSEIHSMINKSPSEQDVSEVMERSEVLSGRNIEMDSTEPLESGLQTDKVIEDLDLQCVHVPGHPTDKISEDLIQENQTSVTPDEALGDQSLDSVKELEISLNVLAVDQFETILDHNSRADSICKPQDGSDLLSDCNSVMSEDLPEKVLEIVSTTNEGNSDKGVEDVHLNKETNAGILTKITVEECSPGLRLSEELESLIEPKGTLQEEHYSSVGIGVNETETEDSDIGLVISSTSVETSEDGRAGEDHSSVTLHEISNVNLGDQPVDPVKELEIPLLSGASAEDNIEVLVGSILGSYSGALEGGGDILPSVDSSAEDTVSTMNVEEIDEGHSNDEAIVAILSETVRVEDPQENYPNVCLSEELESDKELEQTLEEHQYSSIVVTETEVKAGDINNDFLTTETDPSLETHHHLIQDYTPEKLSQSKTEEESQSSKTLDSRQFEDLKVDKPVIPLENRSLVQDIDLVLGFTSAVHGEGDLLSDINSVNMNSHPTEVMRAVSTCEEDILDASKAREIQDESTVLADILSDTVPDEQEKIHDNVSEEIVSSLEPSQKLEQHQPNSSSQVSSEESYIGLDIVSSSEGNGKVLLEDQEDKQMDPSLETLCGLITDHTVESKEEEESLDDASKREFGDLKVNEPVIPLEMGYHVEDIDVIFGSTSKLSPIEDLSAKMTDHRTEVISLVTTTVEKDISDTSKECAVMDESAVRVDILQDTAISDDQEKITDNVLAISSSEELGSSLEPSQQPEEYEHNPSFPVSREESLIGSDIVNSAEENEPVLLEDQKHEEMDLLYEVQSAMTLDHLVGFTTSTSTVKVVATDEAAESEKEGSEEATQKYAGSKPSEEPEKKLHEEDFSTVSTTGIHRTEDFTGSENNESLQTRDYFGPSGLEIQLLPSMDHTKQVGMEGEGKEKISNEEALRLGQNKHLVTIHTEDPGQLIEPPTHIDMSEDQERSVVDQKRTLMEPSVEEDDDIDNNLLPHNTLNFSAQKSRVQLRRKTSIRRKQGPRQVTPESELVEPPQPVSRPRPMGVAMFPGNLPVFPVASAMTSATSHPPEEPKEAKPAEEEFLIKPKKGIPKHAGFGIPHPQMMQELQARLKKKKPNE